MKIYIFIYIIYVRNRKKYKKCNLKKSLVYTLIEDQGQIIANSKTVAEILVNYQIFIQGSMHIYIYICQK